MEWSGTWETICIETELETIRITGNGKQFELVLGSSEMGDFLCIPSHDVGFALNGPVENVYVEEHLLRRLDLKDSITITTALRERSKNKI